MDECVGEDVDVNRVVCVDEDRDVDRDVDKDEDVDVVEFVDVEAPPHSHSTARRRSSAMQQMTVADLKVMNRNFNTHKIVAYFPAIVSILWVLLGTLFYALHDQLGWARALFMSVNVGWSIGWSMEGLSEYDSAWSKLFTIYHTSIGVLFAGVKVLYIAQEVGKNKDNWIIQVIKMKELDVAAETEGFWDSFVGLINVHMPTLRIIFVFLMWFTFGLVWYPLTNPEFSTAKNVDWILSTLTAGGYLTLPSTVDAYQLIVTALYTNIGVPLLTITLGVLMSGIIEAKDDKEIFHRIIAPVTAEEISSLQEFGLEDGDGCVDNKEFIIMAVMRIGGASSDLVKRINKRFKELDVKNEGKILYNDIIKGKTYHVASNESLCDESPESSLRISSRKRSRANSTIFAARAKFVFHAKGSSSASEIAANILRIEELMSSSPTTSSRRVTLGQSMHSRFSDNDSDNDDNVENGGIPSSLGGRR